MADTSALKLSDNSKVRFCKGHDNSLGLPYGRLETGGCCPGSTDGPGGCLEAIGPKGEKTCYVDKLARIYKAVGGALQHNASVLQGHSREEMAETLKQTIEKWRKKKKGAMPAYFRWHWSGDVFSTDYAWAMRDCMEYHPTTRFWMYTRVFQPELNVVPILAPVNNLALYISIDPVNVQRGLEVYEEFKHRPNVSLAYMGDEDPRLEGHKFVPCPGITDHVKGDENMGECAKCRMCFTYCNTIKLRKIRFGIH